VNGGHVADPISESAAVAPEEVGTQLARAHRAARLSHRPGAHEWQHFTTHLERLQEAFRSLLGGLTDSFELRGRHPRAAEWLLDNEHVVEQALREVRDGVPERFYKELPRLELSAGTLIVRIRAVADSPVEAGTGHPDAKWIKRFLGAYQAEVALTIGELWALPTMLRLVVLERLADLGTQTFPQTRAEQISVKTILAPGEASEAISACVLGLRFLEEHDWKAFVEAVSLVETVLREDPAGIYAGMDFATRNAYRNAVERLASGSGLAELEVARSAKRVAVAGETPVQRHVGYHLVGEGISDLEKAVEYRAPRTLRLRRLAQYYALPTYLLSVLLLTGSLAAVAAALALAAATSVPVAALLTAVALLPASAVAVGVVNYITSLLTSPRVLPKLDLRAGIGRGRATMAVVPCLLASEAEIAELLRDLEVNYLGNRDPCLHFALLTDFTDAETEQLPGDEQLLETALAGIRNLNRRHGGRPDGQRGPFHLLHRPRRLNSVGKVWMGWERKRGKLSEFNRLLESARDDTPDLDAFAVHVGDAAWLGCVRFVITLDADTFLPRGAACRLVATMAHPLNRPRFADDGSIEAGYTVMQPRIDVNPRSGNRTSFARVFVGERGLDLYNSAVSDVYQDLFGEGNFAGKGIYDPFAFERSLAGRVPDNALLSHDLFEGIHGRAGLVSDVLILEDSPTDFLTHAARAHRWIRGDWQLLPWLLPWVPGADGARLPNRLSPLGRWKIIDNLRRSLVASSLLLMLACGWVLIPGMAWLWTILAATSLALPVLLTAAIGLQRKATARPWVPILQSTRQSLRLDFQRWLLTLTVLPHEAVISVDAIARTLWRLAVSRRRLLEWTTAAQAARTASSFSRRLQVWRRLAGTPLVALLLATLLATLAPQSLGPAAPLLLLWLLAPEVALRTSREQQLRIEKPPTAEERQRLRAIAQRTWRFFEFTVTADNHWLPPDHYQEEPGDYLARRTSPTDIGMLLLGTAAAWDLGYLTATEFAARVDNTLESMVKLRRYRGHLLNWHDTETRAPLLPEYVSTVDSGNLAGSLVVVQRACLEIADAPLVRTAHVDALGDTVKELSGILHEVNSRDHAALLDHAKQSCDTLRRELARPRDNAQVARWVLADAQELVERLGQALISLADARPRILDRGSLAQLRSTSEAMLGRLAQGQGQIASLLPWISKFDSVPTALTDPADADLLARWEALQRVLERVPSPRSFAGFVDEVRRRTSRLRALLDERTATTRPAGDRPTGAPANADLQAARSWLRLLEGAVEGAGGRAAYLAEELESAAARCSDFVDAMDFRFLLDRQRGVFHLGYNIATATLDRSCYDLLASEARVASFLSIAKGDVPPEHWLDLGRPFGYVEGEWTLQSWSGTSFEYLLPSLLMHTPRQTLLGRSCQAAIARQISFATANDVPWGISESGYHELDADSRYRYRAFGVPGLGLSGSLGDRLVVSPYASILALPFQPGKVLSNLAKLIDLGALGRYGLFEAVDFGRTAAPPPRTGQIVRSYMAHHQGMILAAIANRLCDGVMLRRFHADQRMATAEPLVHERLPDQVPGRRPLWRTGPAARSGAFPARVQPWLVEPHHPCPQINVLSNGRLRVLVSASGGGACSWRSLAVTRWTPDAALGTSGHWVYLRDRDRNQLWSVGIEPTRAPWDSYEAFFSPAGCRIARHSHGILAQMEVAVAPADNVEVRRLELHNEGDDLRRLSVTSYAEVVLGDAAEARRHPAFAKLFVESCFDAEHEALLFQRRPRRSDESPLHLVHVMDVVEGPQSAAAFDTDRRSFLGRLGSAADPDALRGERRPSSDRGPTLDPIMAMSRDVDIPPRGRVVLLLLTAVGRSRRDVLTVIERHRSPGRAATTLRHAHDKGARLLRELEIPHHAAPRLQELLSALLFPQSATRAPREILANNRLSQRDLWRFGISGDAPILLATAADGDAGGFLDLLIRAHALWLRQGLAIDLVILDDTASGYSRPLRDHVRATVEKLSPHAWMRSPAGVQLIGKDQVNPGERLLLESTARVLLRSDAGSLARQLAALWSLPPELPHFVPVASTPTCARQLDGPGSLEPPAHLLEANEFGGFTADGRDYAIHLEPGRRTPAPWANVLANPTFGCLVTESTTGCSWAVNSSENRLTTWHNDTLRDPASEVLYLRDEETGRVWSATPSPRPGPGPYSVRHGAGISKFLHASHGLEHELEVCVDPVEPVKIVTLRVRDLLGRPRRLTATYYAEWVLGAERAESAPHLVPEYDPGTGALLVRNPFNAATAERVAFLAASRPTHGVTADRVEFLGSAGRLESPAALGRVGLSGRVDPGSDPCGALQIHLDIEAGAETEAHFLLGQGRDRDAALALVRGHQSPEAARLTRRRTVERWDELLQTITVETPDPAMNLMLNRWLLYQTLSCRMWGRTGLYQSSGAFGFRDQLQDSLAALWTAPELVREHLCRAAAQQFMEGDVLHWWHPPGSYGVRTRCSDDMLWLPFVAAEYVRATGDAAILHERIPFLSGGPLAEDEMERFARYAPGAESGSLYRHCLRAIRCAATAGPHGLPLIGSGDWNDGLNRVGIEGRGESVWLGWFLYATLTRFAPLCEKHGDLAAADQLRQQAEALQSKLEEHAWDGEWYRRAYFDDGTPLGSSDSPECRIDLTAQTWAVMSGGARRDRQRLAMQSVDRLLVRDADRLVLLLTPPFDTADWDPGYIKGYPPGVRENGGQYTHAAVWASWAFAELGDGDRAWQLFDFLNPVRRHDSPEASERYRVEPYVMPGDVYSEPPHVGRGGWTWYTGSASWMYRLGIEAILGLRLVGDGFEINPCIPKQWPGFQAVVRRNGARYDIRVDNTAGAGGGVAEVRLDEEPVDDGVVRWRDDHERHRVTVRLDGRSTDLAP